MPPRLQEKKRVLVVGAGAAGMACAETLAEHQDRFDVTLVDAVGYCGGQAFSIPIDKERFGVDWMNQGVQGGSYIYHHTFRLFKKHGFEAQPVDLQVSFGKGDNFWSNVFPTHLVAKHQAEIRRFSRALKIMRWFEFFFAVIPIKISLKMFFFSDDFMNYMIYPSLALFLGTGNATPDLPTVMMERLYTSPTYGMWYPADAKSLSSNLPPMVVFPESTKFYTKWKESLETRNVKVRLNTEVVSVLSRSKKEGVKVSIRPRRPQPDKHNPEGGDADLPTSEEHYDEIVFCVLADTANRILGKRSTFFERRVLGSTKWSNDITVTHTDIDYIKKWYTVKYDDQDAVRTLGGRDESSRIKMAETDFMPMYLIKNVPADARKLEMCFDCSAFQYQLDKSKPMEDHIFQTIFLNDKHKETWSIDEIDKDKIIRQDWWFQLMHSYTHYIFVVPWMWILNRTVRTTYAGSWTLVNAHELAVISGIAAAYKLGAEYPEELEKDSFALLCFRCYLLLSHGKWYSKGSHRSP